MNEFQREKSEKDTNNGSTLSNQLDIKSVNQKMKQTNIVFDNRTKYFSDYNGLETTSKIDYGNTSTKSSTFENRKKDLAQNKMHGTK